MKPRRLTCLTAIWSPATRVPRGRQSARGRGPLDAGGLGVAGPLRMAAAPRLKRNGARASVQRHLVVVDLRELSFVDGSGVRAIVDVGDRAREAGPPAALVAGSLSVDRVFALTWDSEAAAIAGRELVESSVLAMARRARGDRPA